MDVMVLIDKELGISGEEFARTWNASPAHVEVAIARPVIGKIDSYDPATVAGAVVAVLGALASGVAGNALYDLINTLLKPKAGEREMVIRKTEHPDGTKVIEVRLSERD